MSFEERGGRLLESHAAIHIERAMDRALSTSLEWLSHDPENLLAHRVAAQSLVNLDREPEAAPHVERVLAGSPEDDFALD